MSVHLPKRRLLLSLVLSFCAAPLFALNPSARSEARMVYSPAIHRVVLYGGITPVDHGTGIGYELNDTWERTASRWLQMNPAHNPGKRASHVMVYDSNRSRVMLFGGHAGATMFNDTWVYQNGDWTQLNTPNMPTTRFLSGAAYDPIRDRIVLFGGNQFTADGKTSTSIFDTWEFDGTTWTQRGTSGPSVIKPVLVYDAARNVTLMLGVNDKSETLMYQYQPDDASWKQLTPTTLPACVNEASFVYDDATQKVFYTGGVCAGSSATEDNLEWDGTNWSPVTVILNLGRVFGAAMAYDSENDQIVLFGGANVLNVVRSSTWVYASGSWVDVTEVDPDPQPRSLFAFVSDPVNNAIWMFGGVNDETTFEDFWKFQNGQWTRQQNGDEPVTCTYPVASYDSDRQKMVMLCEDSSTWEFDGAAWKQLTVKDAPTSRRFSSMVYDPTLKKTVLFGGYDTNYLDQTWLYDGTNWTRVAKKNPPPMRGLTSMWYDPTLKKTVIYGGLGRTVSDGRLLRLSDQWTFDGTNWTQYNPVKSTPGTSTGTPGQRYGAEVAIDPQTNMAVLFGGMRLDTDSAGLQTQVYADDFWQFDGTNWTKLSPSVTPPARENAGFTFDTIRNELVMFSGFAGTYYADTWGYTNGAWHLRVEKVGRQRSAR